MTTTIIKFPSSTEGEFVDVTINTEFVNTFTEVIESGLFVMSLYWHPTSFKNIPKFQVKSTGQVVSVLPLIGVKPNSKSRRQHGDECNITREVYNTDRLITPLSFNQWVNWLNGGFSYYWEDDNRLIHDIHVPVKKTVTTKSIPVVSEPNSTSNKTPLDTLMEAGLTREEAIKAITHHYFNK